VRVGSTSGAASISIVSLGQAGEAKLVEGIEAFGIASLPALKARSPACNPAAGPQQWRGAPPRAGRLDRQPQLPEENRAVELRGPNDSLRRQHCSNDRAGQGARKPYPEAPGIVAQQRRESQAAHSGGVGNMDLSRQNWNQAPGTHMTGWGHGGTHYTCRLRVGDVKWRLGDGYLIHRPGKKMRPSCPKPVLLSV
jgi:hypothetical protein